MEDEEAGSGEDREVKLLREEDEANGLEGVTSTACIENNGLEGLTSTACFACDVATQTPLPAKPCCSIM